MRRVSPLLALAFVSGACALVYQIAWTRELRLVFGASTRASAAVLVIFIGGLGLGAKLLGERAQSTAAPLAFYARLELGIAIATGMTPVLLGGASRAYIAAGGSVSLGVAGATALRLVLSALVLGVPTLLMGGTLPALARVAIRGDVAVDPGRTRVGLLYGANTLGAVAGCMAATFVLLERLGTHATLWTACLANALLALAARAMARRDASAQASQTAEKDEGYPSTAPTWFVCAAAATSGFAFFLMELVFYRMLVPLLGGTVYTFGLVLAVALLGIGLGGGIYALAFRKTDAQLTTLATTTLVEAIALTVPYALGDRVAILALWARPTGEATLGTLLGGWLLVTAVVVLPVSLMAGLQFPVLVGLLGRGGKGVSRDVGRAYSWNTLGAIAGAAAGGFGLMPLLTAPGCWRFATAVLFATAIAAAVLDARMGRARTGTTLQVLLAVVFLVVGAKATGPTAAWRHSSIGAGRVGRSSIEDAKSIQSFVDREREGIVWDADGIESTVGIHGLNGYSFLTNGKSDGHCVMDAPTQVMGGLLGALLHPHPRSAMVIGLGSGSSAGWLGRIPGMEQVDVIELEPAMLEVARRCAAVNEDVLHDPRVHVTIGDAREVLSVTPTHYDVVFSEPSNPYRAGVASLYTREYYERAANHLQPGGIFVQWVQGYEIDRATMETIIATIAAVFPDVEAWQLEEPDLALVASREPIVKDATAMRARVAAEPFQRALMNTWLVDDLEGVLAHFVAPASFARTIEAEARDRLNTDDRTIVEFGFGRTVGGSAATRAVSVANVREWAGARGETRPTVEGEVDWSRVDLERAELPPSVGSGDTPYDAPAGAIDDVQKRVELLHIATLSKRDDHGTLAAWDAWAREREADAAPSAGPITRIEAHQMAVLGVATPDERGQSWVDTLEPLSPLEAMALRVTILEKQPDRSDQEADLVERALVRFRTDPWADRNVMWDVVFAAGTIAERRPDLAPRMLAALSEPFAAGESEYARVKAKLEVASKIPGMPGCLRQLEAPEMRCASRYG
ncbi:MAG TPA: fused MFS/spermidine synthase, partial [Polyangiaceae bacterium]